MKAITFMQQSQTMVTLALAAGVDAGRSARVIFAGMESSG
jgi:hypothetical protein